jgi:hypothetical protein
MTLVQSILAVLSGGIVGLSLGLLGGGGSILAIPLLLYVVGLKDPHVVIGTTALAVSVNSYVNLIAHWRAGHVKWKAAIGFSIPGILGAVVGSYFGRRLHGSMLLFLFAFLMLIIAAMVLKSARQMVRAQAAGGDVEAGTPHQSHDLKPHWPKVGGSGFLVGALSGFFGIGGGFLIVPALVFSADMTFITAIGTSLFAVGTFGLTTAVTYALSGLINFLAFAEYVAGGALGGIIGARLATRMSQKRASLNYLFTAVLIVVAVYMLYKNALMLHL